LDLLLPIEKEIVDHTGICYLRHIAPCYSSDHITEGVVINFIDISDANKSKELTQRLSTVVRDSNDAVTVMDVNGKIIAWNSGAQKMYGWSEKEALTMQLEDLVPDPLCKATKRLLQRIAKGDEVHSIETNRVSKDRRKLDVCLTITPV
jgi:two-component system CheB/CheR fusion protein